MTKTEAFMSKVVWNGDEDECWTWAGSPTNMGYGRFGFEGHRELAHRVSYRIFKGDIPDGLHIDHLCRTPMCVNPVHLEAVTCRTNVLRGIGPTAANAKKEFCKRGHALTPENTYVYASTGYRNCRICKRMLKTEWDARQVQSREWAQSRTEDR
jgi:hypothetical protein